VFTVRDCLHAALNGADQGMIVDYFGGSGTTAHAAFMLYREGLGCFDFCLIESGEHFNSVLLPRVLRSGLSSRWEDGLPTAPDAVPSLVVSLELESFDDALDSVVMSSPPDLGAVVADGVQVAEDYILRYMLDLDSRDSLLNIEQFRKPWSYTIKSRKSGKLEDTPVDLVETFNYLLGLRVERYDTFGKEGILFVSGLDPDNKKVMVIWRDCELWDDIRLQGTVDRAFEGFRPADYDVVYVNGDPPLVNWEREGTFKIRGIEGDFHRLMFDTEEA